MGVHAALCLDVVLVNDTNETGLMFATGHTAGVLIDQLRVKR